MRIRYGKPIKVKSLLGQQYTNLVGYGLSTSTTNIMFHNGEYNYSWYWDRKVFNITANAHKYFFYVKFKNDINIRHNMVLENHGQSGQSITMNDYYYTKIVSNERYCIFDNTNNTVATIRNIYFYYNSSYSSEKFNSDIDIPEYYLMIDLTDIFGSGKEPTKEQFYNKYNKYFSLIATGEEITIDTKSGKIPLTYSLPKDYTEVEYIKTTGTQYLDLNLSLGTNNFEVKTTISFNEYTSQEQAITSIWTSTYNYWNLFIHSNKSIDLYTQSHGYASLVNLNTKYNIIIKRVGSTWTFGDTSNLATKTYTPSSTNNTTLKLLTRGDTPTTSYSNTHANLYKAQVYVSDELVRNMIPCIRNSDNKPGMYDLVNGVFYTNAGTGEFLYGPLKTLPNTYQRVEYIESTGTQYIDSGITLYDVSNHKIIFDVIPTQFYNYNTLWGSTYDEDTFEGWIYSNGSLAMRYNLVRYGNDNNIVVNSRYLIEVEKSGNTLTKKVNEVELGSNTVSERTTNANFLLLLSGSDYGKYKVYSCKLYKSNELVRNFIPAIRKSDNVIGLFDLINNTFYTNQGTGTFIAGPVKSLPSEYQEVEYTSMINDSTNGYGNGILTSIAWNSITKIKVDLQVINYSTGHPSVTNQNIFLRSGASSSPTTPWINIRNASTPAYSGLDSFSYSTPYDSSSLLINHQTLTFTFTSSSTNNIYIGSWYDSAYSGSNKLYKITFYNNDNIVGKLIPCYRKSDNVIGMYDLINRVFYTNQGTGTFLKGPNINTTLSCKIAGGSSDIYYGYNNLAMPLTSAYYYSEYNSGPTNARTFDSANNSTTYTADGSNMNFRLLSTDNFKLSVIEGHYYYVKAKFIWNCANAIITKMANLSVLTSPGINVVDYGKTITNGEYFENIHMSRGTGTARWVWSPLIGSGSVQTGDTFTMSNLEIIDLTDWFGVGKEPSTVQEFKEKFAKDYYGFCPTPIKLTRYQIEALPTYGYNQLCINGDFSNGKSSWTDWNSTTVVTNGIAEITRTNTSQSSLHQDISANPGDKIYVRATMWSDGTTPVRLGLNGGISWSGTATTSTTPVLFEVIKPIVSTGTGCRIELFGTGVANTKYYVKEVNSINLTDWYGEGNEPTTVEEFKATFTNKYYPYSKKRLLNKYMINKLIN